MVETLTLKQIYDEVANLDILDMVFPVKRDGKNLVLSPEILAMFKPDSTGRLHPVINTLGKQEVTEDSATAISQNTNYTWKSMFNLDFMGFDAEGGQIASSAIVPWLPIPSVVGGAAVITADGSGNIGAEAIVVAAHATLKLDLWLIIQVSVTGAYQTQWGEDAGGTLGAMIPDYFTANHSAYMVAGYPYILRVKNTTANLSFGYGAGTNGEWPNSAVMYITGFQRGV